MAELLLVSNPKRRKRRRMSALQRKYFGKGRRRRRATSHRRRRHHARAAAPVRRHRRRRHAVAAVHHRARRRSNPHRIMRRRYRRHHNPTFGNFTGRIMPTVKAGAWGAAGALGLDVLWGFASGNATLSPYLSNQYVGFAAKGLGAVLVGAVGGKLLRGRGRQLAEGAMTVVMHDFLKSLLQTTLPTVFGAGGAVPLGAYLSGSAPIVGTATVPQAYLPFSGYGAYLSGTGQSSASEGTFYDDTTGMDPWGGSNQDGRIGYSGY